MTTALDDLRGRLRDRTAVVGVTPRAPTTIPTCPASAGHGAASSTLAPTPLMSEALRAANAVLILPDHSRVDDEHVVRHAAVVVDTRSATHDVRGRRGKVVKA